MNKSTINKVFIAKSLDGYISDKNEGLDWLQTIPNPGHIDMGYGRFMEEVDAIVMGRKTFETVCNFDIDWPYKKPVFVLSQTLKSIPVKFSNKAELVTGSLEFILKEIQSRGFNSLYIDGGTTIQSFLNMDLIDELTITTIPILLGGGSKLFSELPHELKFEHVCTEVFWDEIVQSKYKRKR